MDADHGWIMGQGHVNGMCVVNSVVLRAHGDYPNFGSEGV